MTDHDDYCAQGWYDCDLSSSDDEMGSLYATLNFDLNNAVGEAALERCLCSGGVLSALWDFASELRSLEKYGDAAEQIIPVARVRAMLWRAFKDRGLSDRVELP